MRKTAKGRWTADKPVKAEPTETEIRQSNLRSLIGLPDDPFIFFESPEDYEYISMPPTWPIEDMWMRIGRMSLQHEQLRKKGME